MDKEQLPEKSFVDYIVSYLNAGHRLFTMVNNLNHESKDRLSEEINEHINNMFATHHLKEDQTRPGGLTPPLCEKILCDGLLNYLGILEERCGGIKNNDS